MSWCFALVNNRLAEIYFDKVKGKSKIVAHCYVKRQDYRTKKEQKWIKQDTKKYRLIYQKGRYKMVDFTSSKSAR